MVSAQHVADRRRAFAERLVVRQVILVHCIQNSAVHGLETVAHVGQRTADDDAHRVFDIARRHFADQLRLDYVLLGKSNVFRFVILILTCHFFRGELTPLLYVYCVNPVRSCGVNRIVSHPGRLCYISAKYRLHPCRERIYPFRFFSGALKFYGYVYCGVPVSEQWHKPYCFAPREIVLF